MTLEGKRLRSEYILSKSLFLIFLSLTVISFNVTRLSNISHVPVLPDSITDTNVWLCASGCGGSMKTLRRHDDKNLFLRFLRFSVSGILLDMVSLMLGFFVVYSHSVTS